MARRDRMEVKIENARLLFTNFSGRPTKFNADGGKRSFCVVLEPKLAKQMAADGWHVRFPEDVDPEEEGDAKDPIIQVKLGYNANARPPQVILISSNGRQHLTEDLISILDSMDFSNVDVIFNSYPYDFGGRSGIAAYLKKMYLVVDEDELDRKYADIPEDTRG